jgi:hypothetical protein
MRPTNMPKLLKYLFVLDYAIIIVKIVIFASVFVDFESASNPFSREVFSYYLVPFGSYAILNVARICFRRNKYLICAELALNVVYIFMNVLPHQFRFFVLTTISAFIVLYPMRITKKKIEL